MLKILDVPRVLELQKRVVIPMLSDGNADVLVVIDT